MDLVFQRIVDEPALLLERVAQGGGSAGTGFAVALRHFILERRQNLGHHLVGLLALLRVDLRFGDPGLHRRSLASGGAQFICPHRHRWQWRPGIACRSHRLRQGTLERVKDHQQLRARSLQQRRELQVDTAPIAIGFKCRSLLLPMRHVFAQRLPDGLGCTPGLG